MKHSNHISVNALRTLGAAIEPKSCASACHGKKDWDCHFIDAHAQELLRTGYRGVLDGVDCKDCLLLLDCLLESPQTFDEVFEAVRKRNAKTSKETSAA